MDCPTTCTTSTFARPQVSQRQHGQDYSRRLLRARPRLLRLRSAAVSLLPRKGLSHAHCKTKPLAALTKEFKVSDKTLKVSRARAGRVAALAPAPNPSRPLQSSPQGVMTRHGITECADYEYTPATGKAKAGKWKAKN